MCFSLTTATLFRRFYIMTHDGCPGDHGWMSVPDVGFTAGQCPYEIGTYPMFFHTTSAANQLYGGMGSWVICAHGHRESG